MIAMYADNSTLLLHDAYDVQYALHIVEEFSKFSGLVLNKNKTEALMIGKETPDSTNGIKWISNESYIKFWEYILAPMRGWATLKKTGLEKLILLYVW